MSTSLTTGTSTGTESGGTTGSPSTSGTTDAESSGESSGGSSSTGGQSALRYFGFVAISCALDDPLDESDKSEYYDEVAGWTNLAHLCPLSLDISAQLEAAVEADNRAFVDLTAVLFEFVPGEPPSGGEERLALRADVETFWAEFVATNVDLLDAEHVAGFYLVDEPIWNGATVEDVATAAALVDASFGEIPIAVIEAYPVVEQATFPPGVDWVGFDRYIVPDPGADPDYQAELATIRELASDEQELVIILDAQWFPFYEDLAGLSQEDMGDVAQRYYDLAQSEPNVAALIGYSWVGSIDGAEQRGARNLPDSVRATYEAIGAQIVDGG